MSEIRNRFAAMGGNAIELFNILEHAMTHRSVNWNLIVRTLESLRTVAARPVVDPSHVRAYKEEFDRCQAGLVPRDTSKVLDPHVFVDRVGKFGVVGFQKELVVKRELGQGMFGKVFSFEGTKQVLLKGAKSGHGKDDLCWERSMLRVLSPIVTGISTVHKIN